MNLFEVFEEIRVKPDLENVFRDVEVEKVTASRSTGRTVIHLKAKRLIEFYDLTEMEAALTAQFFGRVGQKVELSVKYQLSGQYNPKSLWDLYEESVIEEVGKESRMASFLLKSAGISFDMEINPARMVLDVEDTFVNRTLVAELKTFLETMYEKRFGFQVHVEAEYHEPAEKKKNSEPVNYVVESLSKDNSTKVDYNASTDSIENKTLAKKAEKNLAIANRSLAIIDEMIARGL